MDVLALLQNSGLVDFPDSGNQMDTVSTKIPRIYTGSSRRVFST